MGDSAHFWLDAWHVGGSSRPLYLRLPRLYSFVLDDKVFDRDFIQTKICSPCSICQYHRRQHLNCTSWKDGYLIYREILPCLMFGYGLENLDNTQQKAFMTSCIHTFQSSNLVSGYGRADALWKSKSLAGFFSLIGLTWRTCWSDDIVGPPWMITYVSSAMLMSMKIEPVSSSNVTSVAGFGTTYKLIGAMPLIFSNVFPKQDRVSANLSSLRLCSQMPGIYGSWGMGELSEGQGLLLLHGDVILYMIFFYFLIDSKIALSIGL